MSRPDREGAVGRCASEPPTHPPKEFKMSKTQVGSDVAAEVPSTGAVEMKLEVVVIPVTDVDRAKRFYLEHGVAARRRFRQGR